MLLAAGFVVLALQEIETQIVASSQDPPRIHGWSEGSLTISFTEPHRGADAVRLDFSAEPLGRMRRCWCRPRIGVPMSVLT